MNANFATAFLPRALAAAASIAVTAGVLAVVQAGAAQGNAQPAVQAEFTGEVTPNGPVYRLPKLVVRNRGELFLALPELIDGVLAAYVIGASPDGTPGA